MRRTTLLATALLAGPVLIGAAAPAVAATSAEPTSAVVRGVVKDSAGRPAANVTVVPRSPDFGSTIAVRTDSRGRYSATVPFSKIPEPQDVVLCAAGDTATRNYPKLLASSQDLAFNSTCTSPSIDLLSAPTHTVDITVHRRSVLSGTVKDAKGKPVVGAKVVGCPWATNPRIVVDRGDSTLTDSNGRYSLSMPAGGAALTVTKAGYVKQNYAGIECYSPGEEPPLFLQLEKNLAGVDVVLQKRVAPAA